MTHETPQVLSPRITYASLTLILLLSLALHFHNLGHAGIKDLDEGYHAIVARSLLSDPLTPTLYATSYLPYDYRDWHANHIWLHKPPVALWQIAGSFAVFGDSNFALRLPSALLASAAVALTFLIGRSLFTAEAGLTAALLQALSPAITRLVHGQVFSDHVDVAMLFWCELAIFLLIRAARTGRSSDIALVGIVQAIAWMTKSYPALFVAGLAALLCVSRRWLHDHDDPSRLRLSAKQFAIFLLATVLTATPWIAWCAIRFPKEFAFEQLGIVRHLYRNVEEFAAPWDRLLADYLQRGFLEWFSLAIVATFLVTMDAVRRRDSRRVFLAAWAWGVLLPHVLATSKTPTATLIGWPAAWLAVGVLASDAIRGRSFAVGATIAGALAIAVMPLRPRESVMGYGIDYHFGSIAIAHWDLAAATLVIAFAGFISARALPRALRSMTVPVMPGETGCAGHERDAHASERRPTHWIAPTLVALLAFPVLQHARVALRTSNDVPTNPLVLQQLGKFVRAKSPSNAVFLVDNQERGEHIVAMWWLDRACYPLNEATLAADVETIIANGGEPFILSRRERAERALPGIVGEAKLYTAGSLRPTSGPTAAPAADPTTRAISVP